MKNKYFKYIISIVLLFTLFGCKKESEMGTKQFFDRTYNSLMSEYNSYTFQSSQYVGTSYLIGFYLCSTSEMNQKYLVIDVLNYDESSTTLIWMAIDNSIEYSDGYQFNPISNQIFEITFGKNNVYELSVIPNDEFHMVSVDLQQKW